ncbi:MAG: iron-containing alcohol dehydrogenase [Caulobacteraceae bacterium]|nr:iron-containing alcohol dehydrogenase [Caulobacteraceae bacterium]
MQARQAASCATALAGLSGLIQLIDVLPHPGKADPATDARVLQAMKSIWRSIRPAAKLTSSLKAQKALLESIRLARAVSVGLEPGPAQALGEAIDASFSGPRGAGAALMFGPVLGFNIEATEARYAQYARALSPAACGTSAPAAAESFVNAMQDLVAALPVPQRLGDLGCRRWQVETLASRALGGQPLLVNRPREIRHEDAVLLYLSAL